MKKFSISLGLLIALFIIGTGVFSVHVQYEIQKLPDPLKLKASERDILSTETFGTTTRYAYISDNQVLPEKKGNYPEVVEKRTSTSRTWYMGKDKEGKDVYQASIYGSDAFHKKGDSWYEISYATTTNDAFALQTKSFIDTAYAYVANVQSSDVKEIVGASGFAGPATYADARSISSNINNTGGGRVGQGYGCTGVWC